MTDVNGPSVDDMLDLIRATQDRTALYAFPPAANALGEGRTPRFSRRGKRIFFQFRKAFRAPIDVRALEIEMRDRLASFTSDDVRKPDVEGMNLSEFAAWAGISRTGLSKSLVEIGPGKAPALAPGQVPVRRIGQTRRVFRQDFLGPQGPEKGESIAGDSATTPAPTGWTSWDRQVGELRDRFAPDRQA